MGSVFIELYSPRFHMVMIARIGHWSWGASGRETLALPPHGIGRRAMAPSSSGNNPVRFTIVPQQDGTFGVEASDGSSSELLTSFNTLAEAEAWIAQVMGSAH